MIQIAANTFLRNDELTFHTCRSGGPGGQNVNKLNTRVWVLFDVLASPSLSEEQKQRVCRKLSTRIDKRGVLHVVSQKHRSQEANRWAAVERLQELLQTALKPELPRKKTRIPTGVKEQRLRDKKRRGRVKRDRQMGKEDWE